MKRAILPIIAVVLCSLVACKGEESGYIPESSSIPTASASSGDTAKNINQLPQTQIPQVNTISTAAVPVQTTTTAPANSSVAVNPPHGQPGHRCDISVGAPLNSPAQPANTAKTTNVQPVVTSSPTQVIQKPVTTGTPSAPATAPGMNPAHGQPGHRCDIAVGAPLNSKPAEQNPVVVPVKPDSAAGGN